MKTFASEIKKIMRGKVLLEEPLSRHTSFKIGGSASVWVEPLDVEDLMSVLEFLKGKKVPFLVLGSGTNVLVRDGGFGGVLISMKKLSEMRVGENCIVSGGGAGLGKVLEKALEAELAGLEFAAGIPGTVGGAVAANAGGKTGEIGGLVRKVTVLGMERGMLSLSGKELGFAYRSCSLHHGIIIIKVEIELCGGKKDEIKDRMDEVLGYRKRTQPLDYPCAGCIFKNPGGRSAGGLIESAGLAGKKIGDARISTKHANFIVNLGRARASDVICLMEMAEAKIFERFGIKLEREIVIVG